MIAKKFSRITASPDRFFILIIIVLLVTMGAMVQSAIHFWLQDKSYQIISMSHALQQRIDSWRYASWQIYDNIATLPAVPADDTLQEIRLAPDIYTLQKPQRKTEVLIFGTHDPTTLQTAQILSRHLDILWGAETLPWSMYYLNGTDNSLILVSTLPLQELLTRTQSPSVNHVVESRRNEMLLQANTLDERETFSSLRYLRGQNEYYFTLRTTFNQPGLLATIIALDLPVNDLIPADMSASNFRIDTDTIPDSSDNVEKKSLNDVDIYFVSSQIEITTPVNTTDMRLSWKVPLATLIAEALQGALLPLLLTSALLLLMLSGLLLSRRHQSRHSSANIATSAVTRRISLTQAINKEIITQLPLGVLAHDQQASCTVISNPVADALLPHLNLPNITTLARQNQGIIQVTIDNELYEIHQYNSQAQPQVQIFIIRHQSQELLIRQTLQQAQRLYEKNQQGRQAFMQHIGQALKQPLHRLAEEAEAVDIARRAKLEQHIDKLQQLIDDIQLANLLESDSWQSHEEIFSLQELIDGIVAEVLPLIRRKGLQLLINNTLPVQQRRYGDSKTLHHMLLLLLQYAITTTAIGKITLEISHHKEQEEKLIIDLRDTGNGVSQNEIENLHFPFRHVTQSDNYGEASALTFWLCNNLISKLGGEMDITASESLGTHYALLLTMPVSKEPHETDTQLLDDMVAVLDITANEVRQIVSHMLTGWGATCITPDKKQAELPYSLFLTDNPAHLTTSGILLNADETGIHKLRADQFRVSFNMSNVLQEAVLQLIEWQLTQQDPPATSAASDDSRAQLHASDYYPLFVDTVPDDLHKLYTEAKNHDLTALAQTTHRLKGVFAMLNLLTGKQMCERLECLIHDNNKPDIEKFISDLDAYVKSLL